jgi:streptogramin lyase
VSDPKDVAFPIDGRPYGVAVDAKGNVWVSVAAMPKSRVTELTASNGYVPALHFEVPAGYEAIGVDHQGNVWLQNYEYSELRPFPYLPGL